MSFLHSSKARQLSSKNRFGLCLLALLAACAQPITYERETSAPPLEKVEPAVTAAATAIYRIRSEESLVLIRVGRAGKMAHLGHDHAVASIDVQGFVELAADPSASRAEIVMPLMNLLVDEPEHRQRLELEKEISSDDIAGTYSNMRKVLEAELFPWVRVDAKFASAQSEPPELSVSITMHGMAMEFLVPVQLDVSDERVAVSGQLTLKQSDFGLVPFSAVGGLLQVADELEIEFDLHAVRDRLPEGQSLQGSSFL
ncbi:MAG: YceI family protein [Proteobacteria bacterium]|nr:YceI family protein [Pseudomonadota bacterium]MDA1063713.1 YceI family protein [Pseudomonadota bacterium]